MKPYNLPPLGSLRAFEAASRRASFKAAAAELFVTPTAISHQIRQLETWLGMRVLVRSPRAVTLTPQGRVLLEAASSAFGEISQAVGRLRQAQPVLTLSATTGFLSHWLVPRLEGVRRLLPDIDLRLHASNSVVDLRPGAVDVAIRYGKGPSEGVEAMPLVTDTFAPVCSPRLNVRELNDLRRVPLIHIEGRTAPQPTPDWPLWCKQADLSHVNTDVGLRFTDSLHAVQAAIAGQGIAIISVVLAADALDSGLLVRPFTRTLPGETYYFANASSLSSRDDVVALRNWFRQRLRT